MLLGSVQAGDRINWPLTSKDVYFFENACNGLSLPWTCLKAISVPSRRACAFVMGGLRGFMRTCLLFYLTLMLTWTEKNWRNGISRTRSEKHRFWVWRLFAVNGIISSWQRKGHTRKRNSSLRVHDSPFSQLFLSNGKKRITCTKSPWEQEYATPGLFKQLGLIGPQLTFVELFSLGTVQFVYRMFWEKLSLHDNKLIDAKIFDTIDKFSDVSVGNCDHLPQGKPSKVSSQSPRSNQESSDCFYCFCLINLCYHVQKTFSCLPTTENLNLCQKISFRVCFEKKKPWLVFFPSERLLKQTFPCNA